MSSLPLLQPSPVDPTDPPLLTSPPLSCFTSAHNSNKHTLRIHRLFLAWKQVGWIQLFTPPFAPSAPIPQCHPRLCSTMPVVASLSALISSGSHRSPPPNFLHLPFFVATSNLRSHSQECISLSDQGSRQANCRKSPLPPFYHVQCLNLTPAAVIPSHSLSSFFPFYGIPPATPGHPHS